MNNELKSRLDQEIAGHPVVIYMKGTELFPRCGFSAAAIQALQQAGAAGHIHSVDVLADPDLRDGIKAYSDWPTIPQIYVRGEFLGGADIVLEMHASGALREKVEVALATAGPGTV
ncbi:MAG: Grx4 family monothiol glutaredoxin [Gemmatimonadota bacterium]